MPIQVCTEPRSVQTTFKKNPEVTQILLEVEGTHILPIYLQIPLIIGFAVLGAIFSGLTTGLMALSIDDLTVRLSKFHVIGDMRVA